MYNSKSMLKVYLLYFRVTHKVVGVNVCQLVTVDAQVSEVAQMIQVRNHSEPVPMQIQLKETDRDFKYKW